MPGGPGHPTLRAETAKSVERRDGVGLQLRIGLNSGQVIAGKVGSDRVAYTAVGQHVGMAQRMESAAPPGGVMISAATAKPGGARRCWALR